MGVELGSDETLIWRGQPTQGLRFSPQDIFAVPFAALWLLLVIVMFGFVLTDAQDVDPFAYLMLPVFVVIGLYMLVGRFAVDIVARRRTHYMLTDQRAVIESGLFTAHRASVNLAAAAAIQLQGGRKGRGSVKFGATNVFYAMIPPSWPGAAAFLPPTFHDIADAERVYNLAVKAQRDAMRHGRTR